MRRRLKSPYGGSQLVFPVFFTFSKRRLEVIRVVTFRFSLNGEIFCKMTISFFHFFFFFRPLQKKLSRQDLVRFTIWCPMLKFRDAIVEKSFKTMRRRLKSPYGGSQLVFPVFFTFSKRRLEVIRVVTFRFSLNGEIFAR